MTKEIFKQASDVDAVKISRPGSTGYALFRMIFDPAQGETDSAILGIHEHPPGIEPIMPHYHKKVEETVYIVSGEGIVKLGDEPARMEAYSFRAGSCWYIPPGCWHQIINTGQAPIHMVVSYFRNDRQPISHGLVSTQLTVVLDE